MKHPSRLRFLLLCLVLASMMALPALAQRRGGGSGSDKAPAVGTEAPDFRLQVLGARETVHLGQVASEKPVVLIFGSYT